MNPIQQTNDYPPPGVLIKTNRINYFPLLFSTKNKLRIFQIRTKKTAPLSDSNNGAVFSSQYVLSLMLLYDIPQHMMQNAAAFVVLHFDIRIQAGQNVKCGFYAAERRRHRQCITGRHP